MILALLAVFGLLGNYFSLPLFFGVNFIFGSIPVLLVIYLFGARWGVFVALLVNSYTLVLWGHPFAIIVYTLEAVFIGLIWRHYSQRFLLLEGIFWLFLGLPIFWILHLIFIPLDTTQMSLLLLKYLLNGIANASIARLIMMFLPWKQWVNLADSETHLSLRQILLNLIIALVLLPALIIITVNGWLIVTQVKQEIKMQLNTLSEDIRTDLRLLHHHHLQSLQGLVQLIHKKNLNNSNHLIKQAERIGLLFPEFLKISLINYQGHILNNLYQKNNINHQILAPDELFQSVLPTAPQVFTFHSYLNENGVITPIMRHVLPIRQDEQIIGFILVYFNLFNSFYQEHLVQHARTHNAQVNLTDKQGLIINTTQSHLKLFRHYDDDFEKKTIISNNYILFPPQITHAMLRWREAVYVQQTAVSDTLPITVVVKIPIRSYLEAWQQIYVKQLAIICTLVLLGIILAIIVTHWLAESLAKLARITHNLPQRIEKNHAIPWPCSKVFEIDSLTQNFQATAQFLQARFAEIQAANDLLEQRVQIRTQELLHEHTLLRNLIDSIPDLICYKDCNQLYLGCNKAFEEFVGIREADLLGKTDFDILSYEQAVFCHETERQILTTHKPHTLEKWDSYPDGQKVLLETLKTPFFAYHGQILGLIGISRNMTAHKEVEKALRQSQAMLRLVIDNIPQFIFWKDQHGIYLGCNQNFAQIVGIKTPEAIVGKADADLMNHEQPASTSLFETLKRCIRVENTSKYQYIDSLYLADGTSLWLEMNNIPLRDPSGQVIGVLGSFENITERKCADEKLRQWVKVLENSTEAICITNAKTQILQVNKAFTQITGYCEAEILGQKPTIFSSGKHGLEFYQQMWQAIHTFGYWEGEIWNRRKDGEIYPEWLHISVIKDETDAKITNYLGIFSDLTGRKQTEQRLAYLAYYDDLTGLPNRFLFYEKVNHALYHAQQNVSIVAVIFLDLDDFKYINDTWGHLVGDLLLKKVAQRLIECPLCKNDAMARLGGDDFTMVLENLKNLNMAHQFAQNILEIMQPLFDLNGNETYITASIGISLYPKDGKDVDTLLKHADAAMYHAKASGKNSYQFFTPQIDQNVHNRLIMEPKLRRALEREEFVLYYQPQMHLASGQIIGAEALIRWQHPEMGLVAPYHFIPLAEETGLIIPIGEWVLRHTCLQQQKWNVNGYPQLRLSVNLSTRQFQQNNLIKMVARILNETQMDANLLALELTESLLMQDVDIANKILYQLREMGIQLAIDDFGTGYSSLSYLKRFPIDKLKIDQSFIRDIPNNKDDMNITKAIIAMAHNLQMTVIAEGVETDVQHAFLKSLCCDEIQGFLVSRPVPESKFIQVLKKFNQY
jgi:diguanylate cyclase (GGDEF)-like protein/PAS domain S-box-containing protein